MRTFLLVFASFAFFASIAPAAPPVAVDDRFVVDEGGTLTVRDSFPDTVTAQDPSLYWRFDDSTPNTTSAAIDRSDSISSAAIHTYASAYGQNETPTLRSSNGFKGFADTNTWFGFGAEAGTSGYMNSLISPTSGWGSDMGAISFWFKTASPGGDTSDSDDGNKAPDALFAGISAKSSSNKPASYYRTSVLVGLVDGKIIFRVSENDVPIVEFLTTNTYNDSEWHHVVASWDNANDVSGFYVDGGSLGGAAKSETMKNFDFGLSSDFDFSGYDIHVGKGAYSKTVYSGFLDELAIWEHKTLTAENARDLYLSALGGLLSNDTDADGDSLTATKLSDPSAGTLDFNSTGAFSYDATGVSAGTYTFTYKVNDGSLDSNLATVSIKVNGAPTGTDDSSYSVAPGSTLTVPASTGVLANDSDPNGDALSAFLASNPSAGTLALSADGSFTYDATGVSTGTYTFTYKASDGSLEAASANTVTISVTAYDPPVITQGVGPLTVTMSEDGSPTAWSAPTVAATDSDTSSSTLVWGVYAQASHGTATVSGTGTSPSTFTYVPTADYNGTDNFVIQVSDGIQIDTIAVEVTIQGVNDNNPVISSNGGGSTASVSMAENQTAVTTVTATDADGENMTYSITGGDDQAVFSIVSGTGVLTFSSATDFENPTAPSSDNTYVVNVTASDGANTDSQIITVTVTDVNEAPVITSLEGNATASVSVSEGQTSAATVTANDPEGASLTYSISGGADQASFSIVSSTGVLTFQSAPDFSSPADA
ncbi:MAG: hypothetical protein CMI30_01410, partial [Opitutae bacterium]|nr:hypothetical protein [Opitutae bacterium]